MRVALRGRAYASTLYVAAALGLAVANVGCSGFSAPVSRVDKKGPVLLVDETRGSFAGVTLGDHRRQVRQRFGPSPCRAEGLLAPLGADAVEVGGRYGGDYRPRDPNGPYKSCVLRYRGVVFWLDVPDGLISMGTTDPRARTRSGVRIGDSADAVKRRYPGAQCQGRDGGFWDEDAEPGGCLLPTERFKLVRLRFGLDQDGERVTSIWLEAPSWDAMQRLRRR